MSLRELRRHLVPYRHRTTRSALLRLGVSLAVYAAAFHEAIAGSSLALRLAAGLVAGLFSGNLFMIGHDACHGSYTRSQALNRVLGRIAFLPSYHPYSIWEMSHNRTHHVYTNLKGKDFVWLPLSKEEFDALPPLRRLLYRVYRTPLGLSLYYPLDLWLPRLFFPRTELLDRPLRVYTLDSLLVLSFMLAQLAAALLLGAGAPGHAPWLGALSAVGCGVVVPWLVFGWLIGFVVYYNHTHPMVVWYDDRAAWSAPEATVRGTVHLEFPRWTRFFASNIMAHLAHHVEPRVPLVRLKEAQERLEALLPGQVIVQPWSVKELLRILRVCRLYDYQARRWTDYDGRPTTESLAGSPEAPPGRRMAA